jgi:hypothetical protein
MGYTRTHPTLAEILSQAGMHTEVVTRNFVFDGTIPGITRGFQHNTRPLARMGGCNPFGLFLALAKPRFRRHLRSTGFFHPLQRESLRFMTTFARALMPADQLALRHVLDQMADHRRSATPYFLFCNLYDVHAPYPPTPTSTLRPFSSLSGCLENLMFPYVMSRLGSHAYLRPEFRLSGGSRQMLLNRYHRAVELMDAKLAAFWQSAKSAGLLDDTLVIVTSDHGEAFGEHRLYLHDASVYQTHLHVPLWVHHPKRPPTVIDDVVSTRDLFGLIRAVALNQRLDDTILDPSYRAQNPIAFAEHFHYPHSRGADLRYRQNLAAAVTRDAKVIVTREGIEAYETDHDPEEREPATATLAWFEDRCRQANGSMPSVTAVMKQLSSWEAAESIPLAG